MRKKLRALRIKENFTQQEIAEKLGVKRSTYTNIEIGRRKPSFDLSFRIKELFRYYKDDIFLNT